MDKINGYSGGSRSGASPSSPSSGNTPGASVSSSRAADAKANLENGTSLPPPDDAPKRKVGQRQVEAVATGSSPELVRGGSADGKHESKRSGLQGSGASPLRSSAGDVFKTLFKSRDDKSGLGRSSIVNVLLAARDAAGSRLPPTAGVEDRVAALQRWGEVGQAVAELHRTGELLPGCDIDDLCALIGEQIALRDWGTFDRDEMFAFAFGLAQELGPAADFADVPVSFARRAHWDRGSVSDLDDGFADGLERPGGPAGESRAQGLVQKLFKLSAVGSRYPGAREWERIAADVREQPLSAQLEALVERAVPHYGDEMIEGMKLARKSNDHDRAADLEKAAWVRLMRWPSVHVFHGLEGKSALKPSGLDVPAAGGPTGPVAAAASDRKGQSDSADMLEQWRASKAAAEPFVGLTLLYLAYEERLDRLLEGFAGADRPGRREAEPKLNRHLAFLEGELEAIQGRSFSEPEKEVLRSHVLAMHGKLRAALEAAEGAGTQASGARPSG